MSDLISRKAAIDALWKAMFEYEDKTEKQFQESDDLDIGDWFQHRIFVQNMNDIDRQMIRSLPPAQPEHGRWICGREVSRDYIGDACVAIHSEKWWCSECNYTVISYGRPLWNYCPNCGAYMITEAEI